ncbi:MAG: hypothetical protein ABSF52_07395 [Syntrophobacteraceae bacterium]|jgi:hypothetical protein
MVSELAIDLTMDSSRFAEQPGTDQELLAKFKDMQEAQIKSYLTAPDSETPIFSGGQDTTETAPFKKPGTPPMVRGPAVKLRDKFISFHKWEGIVMKILGDSFYAKLTSLFSDDPDEEAEFSLEDIPADDRPLLQVGSVFYWNVGYHDSSIGQRSRSSIIRFRRLPVWTRRDIEDARRRAAEIADLLGWEEPEIPSRT